jgi:hypothetical protein
MNPWCRTLPYGLTGLDMLKSEINFDIDQNHSIASMCHPDAMKVPFLSVKGTKMSPDPFAFFE